MLYKSLDDLDVLHSKKIETVDNNLDSYWGQDWQRHCSLSLIFGSVVTVTI